MSQDFSYEHMITDGKVQIIRKFTVDFDKVNILFENSATGQQKQLNFSRVISLSMLADFFDDYDDGMDFMAYRTLIGFSFEKVGEIYDYVIKVDDYEVIIKSLAFVELTTFT